MGVSRPKLLTQWTARLWPRAGHRSAAQPSIAHFLLILGLRRLTLRCPVRLCISDAQYDHVPTRILATGCLPWQRGSSSTPRGAAGVHAHRRRTTTHRFNAVKSQVKDCARRCTEQVKEVIHVLCTDEADGAPFYTGGSRQQR
jgi:hypothetical protein